MTLGASFVGRAFSGNIKHMTEVIQAGIRHKGFSFIELTQSCPTYNKATPHEWYMERTYDVDSIENYDRKNFIWAKEVADDLYEKLALGVLYQNEDTPAFGDRILGRQDIQTELVDEVKAMDVEKFVAKFR
jgi:2-oxoglutarate ferredoxin oxidoreductase subunit beta